MKLEAPKHHTDGIPMCHATSGTEWHNWLAEHHNREKAVWLVYYKPASGTTRVSYSEAVDEALCFGWIDSKPNKLDEHRSLQFFAPRNPKSSWSKINKEKIDKLTAQGRMTQAGIAVVEAAKASGAWDALNDVEALMIPNDLETALKNVPGAWACFEAFPPSAKKSILGWIHTAKQATTRQNRIQETVTLAAKNERANQYKRK